MALIDPASLAVKSQAPKNLLHAQLRTGDSPWGKSVHWACDTPNQTATIANPGHKSPYEKGYGTSPESIPPPLLKPGYCKVKRRSKMQPNAQKCFYLCPPRNHPRNYMRVLTNKRIVITSRGCHLGVPAVRVPRCRAAQCSSARGWGGIGGRRRGRGRH